MCKHNDIQLDKEAIATMKNLVSDVIKPRRRHTLDYKSLMKNIKQQQKFRNKQVILSPRAQPKWGSDKSLLHAPQSFRNSLGSSKILLPSDTASINLSKRFGIPNQMMHSTSQGILNVKSRINSPTVIPENPKNQHLSSTNAESKHRFYPARIDVSSILYAENPEVPSHVTNPEAAKISTMTPNSFFHDHSSLSGQRFLTRQIPGKARPFSLKRPSTHR